MAIIYFISAKDPEKLQAWLHNTFLNTETKQYPCTGTIIYSRIQ